MLNTVVVGLVLCLVHSVQSCHEPSDFEWDYGGIRRGSKIERKLALVFTGSDFAEETDAYLRIFQQYHIQSSFFVTGIAVRLYKDLIARIVRDGHYLGQHSFSHPLLCDWDDRNKTLVTRDFFENDVREILDNLTTIYGRTKEQMRYWIPPYEWYNFEISDWSNSEPLNLILWCYTQGTLSYTDYAGEGDPAFHPSEEILQSVISYEEKDPYGLNGFALLFHMGAGPTREDKFVPKMPKLLEYLLEKGYEFVTVDELFCMK